MKNWKSFTKRIFINESIESVYRCWTTKKQIENWFLEKADFSTEDYQRLPGELVKKGDRFFWKWNNWDYTEKGQVLEANGKNFVSFTFGSGGTVSVQLKESNGKTEVNLIQEGIPSDDKSKMDIYVGCITGWTFWLTNLKAYLEHGITLHARGLQQEDTTDLVNS